MSKILKSYKILQKLAHLEVQTQQRHLKSMENQEREIEKRIKDFHDKIAKEREFMSINANIDVSFVVFEKLMREEIFELQRKLEALQKNIEGEKEILKSFFLEEKKFEHVYIEKQTQEQKKELYREALEIDDLILMRQKISFVNS